MAAAPVLLPVIEDDAPVKPSLKPVRKLVRRTAPDRSQSVRLAFQALFLVLNLAIGIQFYLFVRFHESGGHGRALLRPPGVEGWLPIAGLMNLKYWLASGTVPHVHPAAMFLLLAFLAISILFRKAFCSWLCPVGTISEGLWKFGRSFMRRNLELPRWVDLPLRGVKYILLGLFLYAVGSMSVAGLRAFMGSPYGLIADVKMLNFFRFLSLTSAVVLLFLVIFSAVIQNFWCRYLCPYGALMGLAALFSPARVRRDSDLCIDCAKCAKACPALLPVDHLASVRSAECTACLECIAVCPAAGALELSLPGRRNVPVWALAAGIAVVFLGIVAVAQLSGHWHTDIPAEMYRHLIIRAGDFSHP